MYQISMICCCHPVYISLPFPYNLHSIRHTNNYLILIWSHEKYRGLQHRNLTHHLHTWIKKRWVKINSLSQKLLLNSTFLETSRRNCSVFSGVYLKEIMISTDNPNSKAEWKKLRRACFFVHESWNQFVSLGSIDFHKASFSQKLFILKCRMLSFFCFASWERHLLQIKEIQKN